MKRFLKIMLPAIVLSAVLCISAFASDGAKTVRYEPSQGQKNIVLRARQLTELEWTPLYDRWQWGYYGTFEEGETVTGVPYGQPVSTGYIGYYLSPADFVASTEDNTSAFYSGYSYYNKVAPYYSTDCSGFVSYSWGLANRRVTSNLPSMSYKVEDQDIEYLEVGDCLNDIFSHVVLVSDVLRDEEGKVISVEIMEQTPVKTRTTRYGEGGLKTLEALRSNYLSRGYYIFRYHLRDYVTYTHSCAVPLDGEWCANCRHAAPYGETVAERGSKTLSLSHSIDGAEIYYTLDGSSPEYGGSLYTGPIKLTETADVRAYARFLNGTVSRVLKYLVSVEPAQTPAWSIVKGSARAQSLSFGSSVKLSSSAGTEIYYTLDGSEPTTESARYTKPILITENCSLKAIAVGIGYKDSAVAQYDFSMGNFALFYDLKNDAWYSDSIEHVYGRELFNGMSEHRFGPGESMSRGMFVTVLSRMAELPDGLTGRIGLVTGDGVNIRSGAGTDFSSLGKLNKGSFVSVVQEEDGWYKIKSGDITGYIRSDFLKVYAGQFGDLREDKYYSIPVQWAYLTGISTGLKTAYFGGDEDITREDMAVMLYNFAKANNIELKAENPREYFSDNGKIRNPEAVYALQRAGIINGMGDGTFAPAAGATRAQVASIITKFVLVWEG